jgi:hypothetical protein
MCVNEFHACFIAFWWLSFKIIYSFPRLSTLLLQKKDNVYFKYLLTECSDLDSFWHVVEQSKIVAVLLVGLSEIQDGPDLSLGPKYGSVGILSLVGLTKEIKPLDNTCPCCRKAKKRNFKAKFLTQTHTHTKFDRQLSCFAISEFYPIAGTWNTIPF